VAPVAIGWVVDDGCPPKRGEGGAAAFAASLSDATAAPQDHQGSCDTCRLLDEELACVGIVQGPITAAAEEWLAGRLPEEMETLPGLLMRKNLAESGVAGEGGKRLRKAGLCEAPGSFSRHWGPFFRRYTVTTDQLLEEMFCAGDIQPAHALGVLLHVAGILIDGKQPVSPDEGPKLAELIQSPGTRVDRTLPALSPRDDDDRSVRELKRFLRALYACFALDVELRVFTPDAESNQPPAATSR
jgi:hypothetical protein